MRDKKQYDIDYAKNNCKRIYLLLNIQKDKDIIEYLNKQANVQGTIKELIRRAKMLNVNVTELGNRDLMIEYESKYEIPAINDNNEQFEYHREMFTISKSNFALTIEQIMDREGTTDINIIYTAWSE